MNKLQRKIRRMCLGKNWKHLDTLHPDFCLKRTETGHEVCWRGKQKGIVQSVVPLKNAFSGSCFIVATGPSLAGIDLRLIEGFDTISLNGAIRKFGEAGFAPTHAVAVDRRIFERCPGFISESIQSGANCFFSPVGISRMCEQGISLPDHGRCYLLESIAKKYDRPRMTDPQFFKHYRSRNGIYLSDECPDAGGIVGFSCDAESGFFSCKTVAGWAVQLAAWMGYRQIFILGMDLGGTGMKHFYATEKNKKPDFLRDFEPYIRVSFEMAGRAAGEHGFSIYNLSEHSTLSGTIIPKMTLDQALGIAERSRN
jgi:Kdo-III transferase WaaZ